MKALNILFSAIEYRPKASTAFKPRPRNDISESETKLQGAHDHRSTNPNILYLTSSTSFEILMHKVDFFFVLRN